MPRSRKNPSQTPEKTSDSMDAIEMLEAQHRNAERLFEALSRAPDGGDRRATLFELGDLLSAHTAIEERHFYPSVRGGDLEEMLDRSIDEHQEVKRLLLHLLDVGPEDPDFAQQIEELQALVDEHVATEESDLFPRAREFLSVDELEGLAQEMTAALVDLEEQGAPREQLAIELEGQPRS